MHCATFHTVIPAPGSTSILIVNSMNNAFSQSIFELKTFG